MVIIINICFVIFFYFFIYIYIYLYIYIYIFNYINYIFIQHTNKSPKLRVRWKNFCMINDFKESDNKFDFETQVNIQNNKIWVIYNEYFFT